MKSEAEEAYDSICKEQGIFFVLGEDPHRHDFADAMKMSIVRLGDRSSIGLFLTKATSPDGEPLVVISTAPLQDAAAFAKAYFEAGQAEDEA